MPNATAVNASGFHLWLKCKEAVYKREGANFTLPGCDEALLNKTGKTDVGSLPMVGELKKLNATDPKALFEQLKAIRLAAVIDKTVVGGLHATTRLRQRLRRIKQEGLGVLTRVRSTLMLVNASGYAAYLNRRLEDLKLIREALGMELNMSGWAGTCRIRSLTAESQR